MHQSLTLLALCTLLLPAVCQAQESVLPYVPAETLETVPYYENSDSDDDRFLVRVEYLYWYLKRLAVPPLLTTGPVGSSALLGEPDTVVLRGGDPLKSRHDRYIGVRGRLEWWVPQSWGMPDSRTIGLQTDFFFLERDSSYFTIDHGVYPVLAVPYVDATTGAPRSYLVGGADPVRGDLIGGSVVYSRIELFGQEENVVFNLLRGPQWELNLLAGARFLQSRERLIITSTSFGPPEGSVLYGLEDKFQTFNKFYGGQLGVEAQARFGAWFVEGKVAAALGGTDELVRIQGERVTHTPVLRVVEPYGLFALPSNLGEHRRWDFDAVGELRVNVGYDLTANIGLIAGYSFLLWDGPVRPGSQVQPVDLTQLDTPAPNQRPQVSFDDSRFWAQGLSVGFHVQW